MSRRRDDLGTVHIDAGQPIVAAPPLALGTPSQAQAQPIDWKRRAEQAEAEVEQWRACFGETALPEALARFEELGQAEAERDRFADELALQIQLHIQRPGHIRLDRRGCQTCKTFKELRWQPSIVAATERVYGALAKAVLAALNDPQEAP